MFARRILLLLAATLSAPISLAQTTSSAPQPVAATTLPAFEVISVKRDKIAQGWRERGTADGYSATGVTLRTLLMEAYGMRSFEIVGAPAWDDDTRYDIEAKVGDSDIPAFQKLNFRQRAAMLQQILVDRFELKVHYEDLDRPIYVLTVGKNGPLLDKYQSAGANGSAVDTTNLVTRSRRGQLTAEGFTMGRFAEFMSGGLGRPVVDKTGLTDRYNIKLDWNPDDGSATATVPGNVQADASAAAPSIFTAVQEQLGLKLEVAKGPVKCLVIDHIERPSEN